MVYWLTRIGAVSFVNLELKLKTMARSNVKQQVDSYLPMLSVQQQELVLALIKSFLNVDDGAKRITKARYNKELAKAEESINKGKGISHAEVVKALKKW